MKRWWQPGVREFLVSAKFLPFSRSRLPAYIINCRSKVSRYFCPTKESALLSIGNINSEETYIPALLGSNSPNVFANLRSSKKQNIVSFDELAHCFFHISIKYCSINKISRIIRIPGILRVQHWNFSVAQLYRTAASYSARDVWRIIYSVYCVSPMTVLSWFLTRVTPRCLD